MANRTVTARRGTEFNALRSRKTALALGSIFRRIQRESEKTVMPPTDRLTPILYGDAGTPAGVFQRSHRGPRPFEEVLWRLREAIEGAGLWILHEIDPQMLLRRSGYTIGAARQILFFHPRFVVRILEADPAALLEVPLKLAVLEWPDGATAVRWTDPASAFSRYENTLLSEIGQELAETCDEIAAAGFRSNGAKSP